MGRIGLSWVGEEGGNGLVKRVVWKKVWVEGVGWKGNKELGFGEFSGMG